MGVEPAVSAALAGGLAGLEPILDVLPSPVLLAEPGTGHVFYANRAAHALAGGTFPMGPQAVSGLRATRSEPFSNQEIEWETPAGTRSLLASGDTIALPGGERVSVVTFQDVSDLQAARRRADLLSDAGPLLVRSLDYAETLSTVAKIVVPKYADWCFVELLTPTGAIERVVMEPADPALRELAAEYDRRFPLDPDAPVGSAKVIRTGEPELLPEIPDELYVTVAQDEEQLRLLRSVGFRSWMIVPLRVRGEVIGDLTLASAGSGRRFDEHDLRVAQELADRCALALDSARLYTELRKAEATARRSRDELEAILGGVADSVTAQAPDGRLVYANEAAVQMLGYDSVEQLLEAPLSDVAVRFEMLNEDGSPLDRAQLPGRQALQGRDPEPLTVRYRAAGDRETRWSRVKSSPVRERDGSVRLAINVIEDITEIKRSEEANRFLAEAGRILSGSLEYEQTLATVARLAVPGIADWCAVDLRAEDGLQRVAVAHVDPAKRSLAEELERRYPPDPRAETGAHAVVRTGRSELYPEIPDELLAGAARDEEHLALLRSVGMRSVMMVPMALHDDVMGVISFVSAESGRRFGATDVELAESLALQAATAVENARLFRTRSAIAKTLQASLLPPALPEVPGFELAAAYRAAGEGHDVGGDFYDVFGTAEDQWYAVMGDVCGKGAEAAAVTALARYTIRAAAVRRRSPAAILRWLNDVMLSQQDASAETGRFCTIACVHLDLRGATPQVTVACGGHPLPAVLRADGSVEELGSPGTVVGLVEDPELGDASGELRPGDMIVLFTDGLTEAGAPKTVWSPADLAATLAAAGGQGAAGVVDHLMSAALGPVATPRDDVAVLALRATGAAATADGA